MLHLHRFLNLCKYTTGEKQHDVQNSSPRLWQALSVCRLMLFSSKIGDDMYDRITGLLCMCCLGMGQSSSACLCLTAHVAEMQFAKRATALLHVMTLLCMQAQCVESLLMDFVAMKQGARLGLFAGLMNAVKQQACLGAAVLICGGMSYTCDL